MIDLRSDTVTKPSDQMRATMAAAPVGDDVYGEDPTVLQLQERGAELFGMEAGLFVPTGVMANQLALAVQTRPGDEVIVGIRSHIFNYETAAASMLSSIQLHTVEDPEGRIPREFAENAIRESAYYMPRTAVISHENTHNKTSGRIVPIDHLREMRTLALEHGIATHIDGARIFNAIVATKTEAADYHELCDTLSVCLSKGLGAPVGSLFLGSAESIDRARRLRKAWGGGWRQAGILAAAGLFALEHNVASLAADHVAAHKFHEKIAVLDTIEAGSTPETNIVVFGCDSARIMPLIEHLKQRDILLSAAFKGAIRAVFHRDISLDEAERAADEICAFLSPA